MAGELLTVALSLMLQVGTPGPYGGAPAPYAGGNSSQVGAPGPSETPNYPAMQNAYNQYGHEGQFEQRYPFDSQQNWVHGYFQEIPAYGGHVFFRPYNYKDVMSQSQTSAGWGMSPTMPYSQQFWHRYHDQATMLKLSRSNPGMVPTPPTMSPGFAPQQPMVMPAAAYSTSVAPANFVPQYFVPQPQFGYANPPMNSAPMLQPAVVFPMPAVQPSVNAGPYLAPQ